MGQTLAAVAIVAVLAIIVLVARIRRGSWGASNREREDVPPQGEQWSDESKNRAWNVFGWVVAAAAFILTQAVIRSCR